jgi:uncharacterized protein
MKDDLVSLLANLRPKLHVDEYVFCVVGMDLSDIEYVAVVVEAEGTTVVLRQREADRLGLSYDYRAAMITLNVTSQLESVGLTAAVSKVLAQAGISCNVMAGYFHDHLFVAFDKGEEALALLEDESRRSSKALTGD